MAKIKTFEFITSNLMGNAVTTYPESYRHYKAETSANPFKVTEPEDCDDIINKFLEGKELISLDVKTYLVNTRVTQPGLNVIRYTIVYR